MTKRLQVGKYKLYWGFERMTAVQGVNSGQPDGTHILMWDFDGVDRKVLIETLIGVQFSYNLPQIYVLNTGKVYTTDDPFAQYPVLGNYHAYCLAVKPWRAAFRLVEATPHVCGTYLKMAYVRGYFTLRFSDKDGREVWLDTIIPSQVPEDLDPRAMTSFVKYLTKAVSH